MSRQSEALRAYFASANKKQVDIIEETGMDKTSVSQILNGKITIGPKPAQVLGDTYGFDVGFLITGKGSLFPPSGIVVSQNTGTEIRVPLIPLGARGGTLADYSEGATIKDCELVVSPIRGADYAIQVTGDSMAPDYPSGSMLLIKKIDEAMFIEWGKVFVLDTANGQVVKIVRPTESPDVVECSSINPGYPPFKVRTEDVRGWYRVLMVMTLK